MAFSDYPFATEVVAFYNMIQSNFALLQSRISTALTNLSTKASATDLTTHTGNTIVHISAQERNTWNAKQEALSQTDITNIAQIPNKANLSEFANYYTKTEIDSMISGQITKEVVSALPVLAEAEENVIYSIPANDGASGDLRDEYMLINGAFEKIGSSRVDLSQYYSKSDINTILSDIATQGTTIISALSASE